MSFSNQDFESTLRKALHDRGNNMYVVDGYEAVRQRAGELQRRRNTRVGTALAVSAVVVAAGVGALAIRAGGENTPQTQMPASAAMAAAPGKPSPSFSEPTAQSNATPSPVQINTAAWLKGLPTTQVDAPTMVETKGKYSLKYKGVSAVLPEQDGVSDIAWWKPVSGGVLVTVHHSFASNEPFGLGYFLSDSGKLSVAVPKQNPVPAPIAVSPDGRQFVYAAKGALTTVKVGSTSAVSSVKVAGLDQAALLWTEQGILANGKTVVRWVPGQSNVDTVLASPAETIDPQGKSAATMDKNGCVHVVSLDSKQELGQVCNRLYLKVNYWLADEKTLVTDIGTVDVISGKRGPLFLSQGNYALWLDNDHLVTDIKPELEAFEVPGGKFEQKPVPVRCTVSTKSCERISNADAVFWNVNLSTMEPGSYSSPSANDPQAAPGQPTAMRSVPAATDTSSVKPTRAR